MKGPWWRQLFVFFGPAYLVSVGYMDPGNWATDLAGGSKFGYALIWVLLMSNLMALLAAKSYRHDLGIVRGRDLAQANREVYPKYINLPLYVLAEIAIAACDLAEVLGMAIGIQLLTGLPLTYGVAITVLGYISSTVSATPRHAKNGSFYYRTDCHRWTYLFLLRSCSQNQMLGEVIKGFIPHLPGNEALYIAIGIIGATVMPHNLYLHSALVQTRKIQKGDEHDQTSIATKFS